MTMRIESENRRTGETEKKHSGDDHRQPETARKPIRHFRDLEVYQNALETGLRVYELSKKFPDDERYALIDQIRRSSRSVCANIAEAWRKRRYTAAFISKLNDSEGEAAETQCTSSLHFAMAMSGTRNSKTSTTRMNTSSASSCE
jgi:four helix bundle protein